MQTAEDLAAKLRAFALDGIVVKHLIEFALPSKKRTSAADVTAKGASAAAGNRSTRQGDATEHTKTNRIDDEEADDQRQAIGAASTPEALVAVPHCQATHPEAHVRIQNTAKTTRGTMIRHTTNPEPALLQSTPEARRNIQATHPEAQVTLQSTPKTTRATMNRHTINPEP